MIAPPRAWVELALLTVFVWLMMIAIPVGLGGIGLSWDALNHHIYLGWVADGNRFGHDLFAASFQSYQYPYLYWPAYQLFAHGFSGMAAGIVLVSLNLVVVPALWLVARCCIREATWHAAVLRACAVALALLGQVSLSLMDTTANDLLAAAPLVWAVAFAMLTLERVLPPWLTPTRAVVLSGMCAGVAVAFKLSNGPLVLVMPLLWAWSGTAWRDRGLRVLIGGGATLAGFLLAYGYWGWLLWREFGNPIFPFAHALQEPLRVWMGWHR